MVSQVVAIFLLLFAIRWAAFRIAGLVALWIVVLMALASAVDYFRRFWKTISRPAGRPADPGLPGQAA
jgi:phosphatidylglycerophosphate synthase